MKRFRWYLFPITAVVMGVLIIWGIVWASGDALGPLRWLLCLGGVSALTGAFFFKRALTAEEIRTLNDRLELMDEKSRFESAKKAMEADLDRRSQVIRQREADLFQKLMTFHEWMEFPEGLPIESAAKDSNDIPSKNLQKDQAVMALIRQRTEQLFEDIKNKAYQKDGRFEKGRLTLDMMTLMESVARIYQPDSENPLFETNVELLLRAVNRIALQMLVVLEQLPLDIKSYNIRNIHDSVQTGLKIYGAYKAANPYWNFLRPVYYLGRYGLGGNPVTLGVTWALGELAKTGARKLSSHVANRYALGLLHDMVFIVGSEAAGIFGGDFRYREGNWVFGAELTELLRRFPLSEATLLAALNEIGRLRLRSEYDRIFLYRCLAARKSADPRRVDARKCLSEAECRAVGDRLGTFFNRYIPHGASRKADRWKAETEARLGAEIPIKAH